MSTPVVPDGGGFVVISQVRPQNDQGNGPGEGQYYNAPVSLPKTVVTFYKGEPEVLGTTQLFVGILLISIGIPVTIIESENRLFMPLICYSGIAIWSGILCIISGSLSVAASVKPTLGKVKASLVMNIFSSLATVCGIILTALQLALMNYRNSPSYRKDQYCAHYQSNIQCLGIFTPLHVVTGLSVFFLMLFTLVFCIAISTSVFACRTACRSSLTEMHVVIYQTTSLQESDATRDIPF
ncbi:membrane-spanning 4-domains subfamily A member 4A-like isoform X2 [Hyla sarda]|nr:membrane-spanning 4-domains subfamily A member 4A-like isoform X2 [Hyla sarda]XP_056399061.1 membrane-spanning 4-domains subfamily A member 4A-like isoform X2 [Hyla sarda]XP_056399062.1 membrane-spanning 4-domains subfamily A member 4A-like isoform X2 [Hyla sarda]XP_056399063.1 membrane-spanning 4-domains subfamily A member 4A-like isoform X2 [Hyla sarda]